MLRSRFAGMDREVVGAFDIGTAARWACCSSVEIVQLILDRNLPWVGRRIGSNGYASIRVMPEHIRPFTRRLQQGLNILEAARELGTDYRSVQSLIRTNDLRSFQGANPVTRNPQTFIPPDAVAEFRARYVSLRDVARTLGKPPKLAHRFLRERGFRPAFDPLKVRSLIYLRSDLAEVMC